MKKTAYSISMSYEVSSTEKLQAEKSLLLFNNCKNALTDSITYLNLINTPFKDNPQIKTEEIIKNRAALRRFRDKSVEQFNNFKITSFKCVNSVQLFSSDTQMIKLIKSFISTINELEDKVNKMIDLFNDFESKDFSKNIVKSIIDIKKQSDDVINIIDERIKNHIITNILARSWVDQIGNQLQTKIDKQTPLVIDLFNKRQDQINKIIRDKK